MPQVEVDVETALPPERVRGALLDFTDRRPDIWPDLDPKMFEVYEIGDTWAEVREGSKMPGMTIWAKERYDWSEPGVIRWTVNESNFCAPGSRVIATLAGRTGGGTAVHLDWMRTPTSIPGRLMMKMIVWSKGKPLASSFEKAMKKLEATSP